MYLVVNRLRPLHRDELVEAIWGDDLPSAPDAALAALVSRLRRIVGPDSIPTHGEIRLVLPPDTFVDLEAASEAIHRAESAIRREEWVEVWAQGSRGHPAGPDIDARFADKGGTGGWPLFDDIRRP